MGQKVITRYFKERPSESEVTMTAREIDINMRDEGTSILLDHIQRSVVFMQHVHHA